MEKKDILDAVAEGIKPLGDEVKGLKTGVDAIDARLKKIEALPLEKFAAPAVISSKMYKGYNLNHQGAFIKNRVGKLEFSCFDKEENIQDFCKFLIAFVRAAKFGDPEAKQDLKEMYAKASLAEGAAATGGYLVPDEYQWDIVQLARSRAHMLQICRVVPMGADTLYIPTEAALATINWKAEAAQLTQGDPTFGQVQLTAKKATAYAISSNELLADSRIDIASILTEQFAYGIALDIDNQVLNGTGDPVSGLLVSGVLTSNIVTTSGASMSTITATDLSLAIQKLSEGDLANAKYLLCRLGLHYIRSLKDTTNSPIFAMPGATVPGKIYEFPYLMSEKIANTDGTAKPIGLFGDFQKYIIGRRAGAMALDVDPYGKFDYDQTRFRMISRWAFALGRETAFTKIITA